MLLASKHLNLVMGVDIHMVTIPPSPAPVPLPHPFIGMVFDVFDYLPILGSMVHVNYMKRSNAATEAKLGSEMHIPMGAGFHPASLPLIAHDGVEFFGSQTVKVDGTYFSGAPFNSMTCSCIGLPLSASFGEGLSRYLPISATIPIPMGNPVFVGGPQVPDIMGSIMKLAMSGALSFLMKKIGGKLFKKLLGKKSCGCH